MNIPIETFIDALERAGTSVKRSGDGWTCRCPGHEDRLASMSISVGTDERVLVHCFAGCTPKHIVKCLGLSMRDLMPPRKPAPKSSTKECASKKPRKGQTVSKIDLNALHQTFLAAIAEERVAGLACELAVTVEALCDLEVGWCDSAGLKVLKAGGAGWEVDAYPNGAFSFPERDGTGQIVGFTLRAIDGSKGCPSGKVGSRRGLIIPKSLLSTTPGDTLFLNVEGASDVAAVLTMGLHAIGRPSNGGGLDDLVMFLKGRKVLTLGENDKKKGGKWPGRDGAVTIAKGLEKALGRGLGRWCLPPSDAKDVRSWLQARVRAGLDLRDTTARIAAGSAFLQAMVTGEPESTSQDEHDEQDDEPRARYEATRNGFIWHKRTADDIVPVLVSTWTANIVSDITEDDGVESRKLFELSARVRDREPVTFTLTAEEFNLMNWPIRFLGSGAITFPGTNNPAHARTAIQLLSPDAERREVFGHTGWRKVQGQWLYLHAAGGIGTDGLATHVHVTLPGSLKGYELPSPPPRATMVVAVRAALKLLDLGPPRIVYALLASPFSAIIGGVDFSQFLVGPTGVFKSETVSLFQRFFGPAFTARHLPASWTSTDNALEDIAFRAKDTLLVIDDFKPSGGAGDDKLHQKADHPFIRGNAGRTHHGPRRDQGAAVLRRAQGGTNIRSNPPDPVSLDPQRDRRQSQGIHEVGGGCTACAIRSLGDAQED